MKDENQFIDLGEGHSVEIEVRWDGKVVWVNVDGKCMFRCHNPKVLEVFDRRKDNENKQK